jgi:hypothetical protein
MAIFSQTIFTLYFKQALQAAKNPKRPWTIDYGPSTKSLSLRCQRQNSIKNRLFGELTRQKPGLAFE